MATIYGLKRLRALEDWVGVVSEKNWRPKHSAFELAHKWHMGKFPTAVKGCLATADNVVLQRLRIEYAVAEKAVFLDTSKAPSMTDLMVYCRNARGEIVIIGIEGKAQESFAHQIKTWIRDGGSTAKPTRVRRLEFLNKTLGTNFDARSEIRYQLLHRTASVIRESILYGASAAVLLVHSFSEHDSTNWDDFRAFAKKIGLIVDRKNVLIGPLSVGLEKKIPLFASWIEDTAIS